MDSPKLHFHINEKTCILCGMCHKVCPASIIGQKSDKSVFFIEERIDLCVKCGQCMAVCPTKSVEAADLKYGADVLDSEKNDLTYPQFQNFLLHRRSIRHFQDKSIPDEMIQKILDSISTAPYGVDINKVEITVVNNRSIIEKALPIMSEKFKELGKSMHNSILRWIISKMISEEEYASVNNFLLPHLDRGLYDIEKGEDEITRNAPCLLLFHGGKKAEEHTIDSHIYLTYAFLAAHSLGLGATVIGLVPPVVNRSHELRTLFQLPDDNEVVCSMILGFPQHKFHKTIFRKREKVTWIR